jgi:arylsulfatase A-like enzyme
LSTPRPNIVLVLADDLGYSDIGCYGGEIRTPNLDRLGRGGVRFTQFFNTARCSPSRASLLTGLHPHQTGVGVLTHDNGPQGYPGSLNHRCATLAELLVADGYATGLSGKWHLSSSVWEPADSWPTRRGFQHFFGTLSGAGSYYDPTTLHRGERDASEEVMRPGFFYTDAIAQDAASFIAENANTDRPFFSYVAFTAPHWPLHAHEEDVAEYAGIYERGWDDLRAERLVRQQREGIAGPDVELTARDPEVPPWRDVEDQEWEARRMRVYAAQVGRLDRGVGVVLAALERAGVLDNTAVTFLSDNGACAEELPVGGDPEEFASRRQIVPANARGGRPIRVGNSAELAPGPDDTYASYGRAWAGLSNTPFRLYKRWVHEGGIAAPMIVHWPAGGVPAGAVAGAPFQLIDFVPTILEITATPYRSPHGRQLIPLEGRSMLRVIRGDDAAAPDADMYWEHVGNGAIRRGQWKLVREQGGPWELYDLSQGRSEERNLASEHPELVAALAADYEVWAARVGVVPWDRLLSIYEQTPHLKPEILDGQALTTDRKEAP